MTDRDKLKKLFDEFGIEYVEYENSIDLQARRNKIKGYVGYSGFSTEFFFDTISKFVEVIISG